MGFGRLISPASQSGCPNGHNEICELSILTFVFICNGLAINNIMNRDASRTWGGELDKFADIVDRMRGIVAAMDNLPGDEIKSPIIDEGVSANVQPTTPKLPDPVKTKESLKPCQSWIMKMIREAGVRIDRTDLIIEGKKSMRYKRSAICNAAGYLTKNKFLFLCENQPRRRERWPRLWPSRMVDEY